MVAPTPRASIRTAVAVKPGDLRSCRKTNFKSSKSERIGASSWITYIDSIFVARLRSCGMGSERRQITLIRARSAYRRSRTGGNDKGKPRSNLESRVRK